MRRRDFLSTFSLTGATAMPQGREILTGVGTS
jgi:hypothetical protein